MKKFKSRGVGKSITKKKHIVNKVLVETAGIEPTSKSKEQISYYKL